MLLGGCERMLYLHWTFIYLNAVELLERSLGATWLAENDGCYTTADASRAVGEGNFLDRSNRFAKVFL